jgi:hypothetical protein
VELSDISYEFTLLDPHVPGSQDSPFPLAGTMDPATARLHEDLIELAARRSTRLDRYDLKEQLLSFYFHESWTIHPVSLRVTKKVHGITPVIWQQRKSVDGVPINDAETGLPVYYKNTLDRIDLRNP